MAGPEMSEPKKLMPDSPMITPRTAIMATRPCLSSDSLYFMKFFLSSGQSPRGSKKPNGPETPASFLGSNAGAAAAAALGMMTLSMTWMTPLSQTMSVVTTLALSTLTPSPPTVTVTSAPLRVFTFLPFSVTTVSASTLPGTTWYVRMFVRAGMSLRRDSTVPALLCVGWLGVFLR